MHMSQGAAEQPAKKRKLLSKKAATAPALSQQRSPAGEQGAARGAPQVPQHLSQHLHESNHEWRSPSMLYALVSFSSRFVPGEPNEDKHSVALV